MPRSTAAPVKLFSKGSTNPECFSPGFVLNWQGLWSLLLASKSHDRNMLLSGIHVGRNLESFCLGLLNWSTLRNVESPADKMKTNHQTKPKKSGKVEKFPSLLSMEKGGELWLWGEGVFSHQRSHNTAKSRFGSVWCWEAKHYFGRIQQHSGGFITGEHGWIPSTTLLENKQPSPAQGVRV